MDLSALNLRRHVMGERLNKSVSKIGALRGAELLDLRQDVGYRLRHGHEFT